MKKWEFVFEGVSYVAEGAAYFGENFTLTPEPNWKVAPAVKSFFFNFAHSESLKEQVQKREKKRQEELSKLLASHEEDRVREQEEIEKYATDASGIRSIRLGRIPHAHALGVYWALSWELKEPLIGGHMWCGRRIETDCDYGVLAFLFTHQDMVNTRRCGEHCIYLDRFRRFQSAVNENPERIGKMWLRFGGLQNKNHAIEWIDDVLLGKRTETIAISDCKLIEEIVWPELDPCTRPIDLTQYRLGYGEHDPQSNEHFRWRISASKNNRYGKNTKLKIFKLPYDMSLVEVKETFRDYDVELYTQDALVGFELLENKSSVNFISIDGNTGNVYENEDGERYYFSSDHKVYFSEGARILVIEHDGWVADVHKENTESIRGLDYLSLPYTIGEPQECVEDCMVGIYTNGSSSARETIHRIVGRGSLPIIWEECARVDVVNQETKEKTSTNLYYYGFLVGRENLEGVREEYFDFYDSNVSFLVGNTAKDKADMTRIRNRARIVWHEKMREIFADKGLEFPAFADGHRPVFEGQLPGIFRCWLVKHQRQDLLPLVDQIK